MDFNQAKRAQLETSLLKKARSEMEELEDEQFEAIKDEDFHRALNLQEEMKTLRGNVLASVDPRLTTEVRNLFFAPVPDTVRITSANTAISHMY